MKTDPSRTTLLRRQFVGEMNKRFRQLRGTINDAIIKNDMLNLRPAKFIGNAVPRFQFVTDAEKAKAFRAWLDKQIEAGVLDVDNKKLLWTNKYVESAYKKGVVRSFNEAQKARGFNEKPEYYNGRQAEFLTSAFAAPEMMSKVQMVYERAYNQLKGITDTMASQLSTIMADGLVHGKSPFEIARNINNSIGAITRKRALVLARTEVIHAHAEGQLDGLEKMGFKEVVADVELSTSHDEKVCEQCAGLEGQVMTIDEARGLIPVHPNCRCSWRPVFLKPKSKASEAKKAAPADSTAAEPPRYRGTATDSGALKMKTLKPIRTSGLNPFAAADRRARSILRKAKAEAQKKSTMIKRTSTGKPTTIPQPVVSDELPLTSDYSKKYKPIIEKKLSVADSVTYEPINSGANGSYKVSNGIKGVHKPISQEEPRLRRGIPAGTYANREVAAYQIDTVMDLNLVPPTVLKEIKGEVGSFQYFVNNAKTVRELENGLRFGVPGDVKGVYLAVDDTKLAMFDFIIGQTDRHSSNAMIYSINGVQKVAAIDNGLAFQLIGAQYEDDLYIRCYGFLKADRWAESGKLVALSDDLVAACQRLKDSEAEVRATLQKLLSPKEVDEVFYRNQWMLENKRLPKNKEKLKLGESTINFMVNTN